jgi:NAD+-dependent secondary alcohol dehydrogenase Adh1
VAGEVAMALVLLIGAGLFVRTMANYARFDPGFRADHLLSVAVSPNLRDKGSLDTSAHVDAVLDLTGGHGAEAVIDFVGEGGATAEGVRMLRRAGNYYVVGYGENINVPTIDVISTEINFIGNLVGSYTDLSELMVLAAQGKVTLHTTKYALDDFQQAIDDLDNGRVRGRAILIP